MGTMFQSETIRAEVVPGEGQNSPNLYLQTLIGYHLHVRNLYDNKVYSFLESAMRER